MNVIVPLGGLGSRFQTEGYGRPKPFIRILGKEMILWVLDNLTLGPDDDLVIVFNPAFLSMDNFMQEVVQARYPRTTLVELAGPTRGAAETVLLGLQGISEKQRSRPCMLCDGDCFYTVDIVSKYRAVSCSHNGTFVFKDTQPKPIYSYVTVKDGTNDVVDIKEKVKISDFANTGCYCFKNGCELEKYCKKIIDAGQMQLSQDQKGEFYTSGVIKAMLDDQMPCKMLMLEKSDLHVLGTPVQVEEWCRDWPRQPRRCVVFNLDGTLVTPPQGDDLSKVRPIARNIEYLRQLHEQGHHIVVSTSRSAQYPASSDVEAVTRRTLASLSIPYHELDFSKPCADIYVDALAVDPVQGSLAKQVGFYPTAVKASDDGPPLRRSATVATSSAGKLTERFLLPALGAALGTALVMALARRR